MGQFTALGLLMILPTFVVMYLDLFGSQCKDDSEDTEEEVQGPLISAEEHNEIATPIVDRALAEIEEECAVQQRAGRFTFVVRDDTQDDGLRKEVIKLLSKRLKKKGFTKSCVKTDTDGIKVSLR